MTQRTDSKSPPTPPLHEGATILMTTSEIGMLLDPPDNDKTDPHQVVFDDSTPPAAPFR